MDKVESELLETEALITFLDGQRTSVLAIVEGLDDAELRRSVVPSGWTPLGVIEHLGFAERYWFQSVATGSEADLPWPPDMPSDDDAPFTTDRPAGVVFGFYRDQCERANAVLRATHLSAPPHGTLPPDIADDVSDLRCIALHMIEETARHVGHLDIAREMIDGRTGLGPR